MRERDIIIQVRLPASPRGRWLLGIAVAVLTAGAVAYATAPSMFNKDEQLSAKKMNDNFTGLDSRLATVENAVVRQGPAPNDPKISVNGIFCRKSLDKTAGNVSYKGKVGYRAVKAICEDSCSNPLAHMCSGEEVSRSFQVGALTVFPQDDMWYSTFTLVDLGGGNTKVSDCAGWQCGANGTTCATESGPNTVKTGRLVDFSTCTNSYYIACCQ